MNIFTETFETTFLAVLKVFLVIGAAGLLVRKRIISQENIKSLSMVTIDVFLPCMIFSTMIRSFRPGQMQYWWVLPLLSLAILGVGMIFAFLLFRRELPAKKNMLPMAAVQNAGYLVLPIGKMLYPDQFDTFATYSFLYILSFSPMLWSLGKHLMTSEANSQGGWKALITPPFVANILGLAMVFTGLYDRIPKVFEESVTMLGNATVPVANFILGAILGSIPLKGIFLHRKDGIKVVAVKFILLPALTLLGLSLSGLAARDSLMADFLVLQAASAPATALVLQVRKYGGDEPKVGAIMLLCYLVCILLMPLWMTVWHCVR